MIMTLEKCVALCLKFTYLTNSAGPCVVHASGAALVDLRF